MNPVPVPSRSYLGTQPGESLLGLLPDLWQAPARTHHTLELVRKAVHRRSLDGDGHLLAGSTAVAPSGKHLAER